VASRTPKGSTKQQNTLTSQSDDTEIQDDQLDENDLALATADDVEGVTVLGRGTSSTIPAGIASRSWTTNIPMWMGPFRNSIIELTKVTWPAWEDARNMTGVVIMMALFFAIIFGALDLGLYQLLQVVVRAVTPK